MCVRVLLSADYWMVFLQQFRSFSFNNNERKKKPNVDIHLFILSRSQFYNTFLFFIMLCFSFYFVSIFSIESLSFSSLLRESRTIPKIS